MLAPVQVQVQEEGNIDTDTGLYQSVQTVIHYGAVDQERTVVAYMDTHLEVGIHKAQEGKGMYKDSPVLPLMQVLELMGMKPLWMWKIWKMSFVLFLTV